MSDKIPSQILEKLQSMENEQRSMSEKLQSMENEQRSMSKEVRSIKADTSDIPLIRRAVLETHNDLKELSNSTAEAIKTDVSELKKGQQRHDKVLESLAVRSLEQETDIRRLKAN